MLIHADETASSSAVTTTPTPTTTPSPYLHWLRDMRPEDRGVYLIQLLNRCARDVSLGALDGANACLDCISLLASPDGDAIQRVSSYFTQALASRVLRRSFPGVFRALTHSSSATSPTAAESLLVRRHYFDLCPFLKLSFLAANQSILDAMVGERVVHAIDLHPTEPAQWVALMQALSARAEGPPHLRVTAVHDNRDLLEHFAARLTEEAEKLDVPFQFHPVVSRIEDLDIERDLRVKTGEAVAVVSILQLHALLSDAEQTSPPAKTQFENCLQSGQGTLGELMEKDYFMTQTSVSTIPASARLERFLGSLWRLSPKVMVVVEQESNHNAPTLGERFNEALNYYAALFDCLESTAGRGSVERARVEKMMLGEEIKDIIACEGLERRERHERVERWAQRMDRAGFGRVPMGYFGLVQARRLLQSCGGCEGYNVREENGWLFLCWQERDLFSVSSWKCRRYE
ncbi:Scarecrow-like protein 3 [Acorus gramineus]|uniref:Scarecrow-like protein 3 n=1 Tax=Acorus gramineus TaxID=55184 RepID=A0AAV9BNV7_ACOGR|nr:Scarecrow-like protein 3 [Acorus gramineus]